MVDSNCFSEEEARVRIADERYIVEEFIGEGGMACVYRARESGTPNVYALKLLKEQYRQRAEFLEVFQTEATHMRDLQHPNIVRFYKMVVEAKSAYILMDFIDGHPLTKFIQRARATEVPFPIDEIVRVMAQIARAISHLHKEGFIHRDVKPGNVLLGKTDGRAYLTDLGITGSSDAEFALSGAGTPSYMPYEQQEAGLKVDHTVDIYSFAIMLFEMFAGQKPFRAPAGMAYDEARKILTGLHQSAPVPDVTEYRPELPVELNAVFHKALAKNPADRYRNVMEFAQDVHRSLLPMLSADLQDFEAIEARVMRDIKVIQQAETIRRRSQLLVWGGALSVLAIVVLVVAAVMLNNQVAEQAAQATFQALTNAPTVTFTLTLVNTSTDTVQPSDTLVPTEPQTVDTANAASSGAAVSVTTTATEAPTATDIPPSAVPTMIATPSPSPLPVEIASGVEAIGLDADNLDINDIVTYSLQQHVVPIPLRLGQDVNGFLVQVEWANLGNATAYGIAFRVQNERNYLLLYVDAVEKVWRVEERILRETEDEQGNIVLENIADNPVLASGRVGSDLPLTLAVSGVDDVFTVAADSVNIAEFTHLSWATGGAGVWLDVADAFDDTQLPQIAAIDVELLGADAIAAQTAMPTAVAPQLNAEDLFMRDVEALAAVVDVSQNLACDRYRYLYNQLLVHQQNLIRYFGNETLANSIAPIVEEGTVINNRCRNVEPGGELDLNDNIGDLLDLDGALQTFLKATATNEP